MRRTGTAGGFFLSLCILAGLIAGVVLGNAMAGVLIGSTAGIALALIIWLIDRRRLS